MRSLGGFVLLAGIGVGLFVYFPAPVDRSTTLEEATRAIARRAAATDAVAPPQVAAPAASRLAGFSPAITLPAPTRQPSHVAAAMPPAAAAKIEPIANWQTTVGAAGSGALEPADPDSRYRLVVDIQQQLKRVGCYWGRANGAWNASTREAMRDFTVHANSALPVDKPDYLLLSLLRSHNGRSCGSDAQTAATAPAEVLPWKPASTSTQATRLYTPVPTSIVTTEPLPGRMSIGGPKDLQHAAQEPLIPGGAPAQPGVATAALDGAAAPGFNAPSPNVAPRPRPSKKVSSSRRATPGTPRYNLMLSLGGVY